MRLSVLLSAAALSFLFLLPQQGSSQQLVGAPPASEQLLQAQREAERAALYLTDLQRLYDAAKARGDKNEYKRLKKELKRMQQVANALKKDYEKVLQLVNLGIQLDYLCATNQNPGMCRKCENGRVVVDNSQSPGNCMKCENGQAVYDNSYLSSCKRCLNGKVVAMNGKTCKPSTECMEYTCEQGRCVGSLIPRPSENKQCLAAK
ncbi:MAG: hypothetical protein ACTFAL_04295 [Candidatus Electronema sp. V4]|uniref:hypothetical protein n=1 Tax=Candidatus Electronema sp. V4 TaxID=3454756 RepID=UPI0040556CE6